MRQPVLPLVPAQSRPVGPSAALLEDADGGAVFVFGMLTFVYAAGDDLARRLAAVQLAGMKVAEKVEVASAFAVTTTTLARWCATYAASGVEGLATERTGPKGPSKLTPARRAQILELDGQGLSLAKIAAQTGVSTATVRVALGRVAPKPSRSSRRATATGDALLAELAAAGPRDEPVVVVVEPAASPSVPVAQAPVLGVLTRPVPRSAERAAARSGDLSEAPVVITEGAHLPLAGLLLALPTLEAIGLLEVAGRVLPPMRKGFYGLRATLLMGVFMALLREPRAQGATRLAPADLGRLLGLDRPRRSRRCAGSSPSWPVTAAARSSKLRWVPITSRPIRRRSGSSTWTGTSGSTAGLGSCPRRTSPGCGSPVQQRKRPGSGTVRATR